VTAPWTTVDIAHEFGYNTTASARSFIHRAGVPALPYRDNAGNKLYDQDAVRAGRERMAGQGHRTDLAKAKPPNEHTER
jgi:hypothetical protein